jgi:acetolactate synthase-1/2/3 large subunit
MKCTGAELAVRQLEALGVDRVTGIPGGACLPLYDALVQSSIRHVLARHEQGAGFIAQGIARVTGRAAVCLATSGPGATNLVTALADARMDSVPLVAITGQVPQALIGTDAFQEVDACAMCAPVTKKTIFVERADDVADAIVEAFAVAEAGRKGPVLVDLPKDVQTGLTAVDASAPGRADVPVSAPAPGREEVQALADMLARARRPILLVGGGVPSAGACGLVLEIARRSDAFVALTLHGLGAVPAKDPLCLGMIGMHGAPFANWALDEADLLVAVGARFDDRATGAVADFCPRARIAHVDVDAREIGKNKPVDLGIAGDARIVLDELLRRLRPRRRPAWRRRVALLRRRGPLPEGPASEGSFAVIDALAASLPDDAIVTTDVGQHQMWVAQRFPFARPRSLLTSGGLGTMGFGLPAAIGAALARPDARVVCVTGDGSLLMNVQELATLAELGLDVAVVVLDNRHLGLVRQQQTLFFEGRLSACSLSSAPSFVEVARGFGIVAESARPDDPEAFGRLLAARGPRLVHVPIASEELVLPMVPPGRSNRDMLGAPWLEEPRTALRSLSAR